MKKSTLKCFSIIFTLSVVFSRLIYAADTNQQALANTSDKGVELINASGATNVEKVRALLTQSADPNTVADGVLLFSWPMLRREWINYSRKTKWQF